MIVKNMNVVERKIHDTYFLIDIKENYMNEKCHLYEINEMGFYIWKQIDGQKEISDIVQNVMGIIVDDVEYSVVYKDVEDYLKLLLDENFLEVNDGRN